MNHGQLPSRPRKCSDAQWKLVEKMTTRNPAERIQICTVVDELAMFAKNKGDDTPSVDAASSVVEGNKRRDVVDADKPLVAHATHNGDDDSDYLGEICKLMWSRVTDIEQRLMENKPLTEHLQPLLADTKTWTAELHKGRDTLVKGTEMALRGYGLHRRLDKFMIAENMEAVGDSGLHNWKTKCCEQLGVSNEMTSLLAGADYNAGRAAHSA